MTDIINSNFIPPVATDRYVSKLPRSLIVMTFLGCILFLAGENPLQGIVGLLVGLTIAKLLWRVGEAQLPLFVCGYQWLQAFSSVLQAELYGGGVADLYGGEEFAEGVWLSLGAVLVFSIGMAWALRKFSPQTQTQVTSFLQQYSELSQSKLIFAWLGILLVDAILGVALRLPGIATGWNPIAYLRLGAALLLFQSVFARRSGWPLLFLVVGVETAIGFLSYFSSFKTIYFLLLLSAATIIHYRKSMWGPFVGGLVTVLGLGLFWQTIKGDYRTFMAGGQDQAQDVNVSVTEQVKYIGAATAEINSTALQLAAINTLRRLEYVIFFGLSMRQVPRTIPHAGGRLWGEAVSSVFMPRLFFPNKKSFNDSDRTNEFCGIRVADASEGTSIGIGYVGESYIDFGPIFMFAPILLFGVIVGTGYCKIIKRAPSHIVGIGFGTALIFSSSLLLESSNAKMLASFVSGYLVLWVVLGLITKFDKRGVTTFIEKEAEDTLAPTEFVRR